MKVLSFFGSGRDIYFFPPSPWVIKYFIVNIWLGHSENFLLNGQLLPNTMVQIPFVLVQTKLENAKCMSNKGENSNEAEILYK